MIYGYEVGLEHTQHLQGYFQLKVKCRITGLLKKGLLGCHLSVARGSADDNIKYCSKEGCAVTWGEAVVER